MYSCASKKGNGVILQNSKNEIYINQAMRHLNNLNPEKIRRYMKESKSDIQHLLALKNLFLESDH